MSCCAFTEICFYVMWLSDKLVHTVIPNLPLPSFRTCFGISFARGMSHGFEIADAISFKEAGYCWVLGHPELVSGSPLYKRC